MSGVEEVSVAYRFGSWYKTDNLADITVCFKVRSADTILGVNHPADASNRLHYPSPLTAQSCNSAQVTASDATVVALASLERSTSAVDSGVGSCCPNADDNEEDSPQRKRPRLQPSRSPCHLRKPLVNAGVIVDRFPAHRLVLGSMSDVFKAQFSNWDKHPGAEIGITLAVKEDLRAAHEMVRFMYFEKLALPLDAVTLIKIARLSDQYQVLKCLEACSDALCDKLAALQPVKGKSADPPTYSEPSNIDLMLAVMMLDETVGTPMPTLLRKCVDILKAWYRDFDTAWNYEALRALFLQLPFNYLTHLLAMSSTINIVSENSIATALHYWAQAQPQGTLTPELSTELLRLLHFQGLTPSYLTIVLPTLPTYSISPDLIRFLGEASRLKMSEAFRIGQGSIDPRVARGCRGDKRDKEMKEKEPYLKPEDWWHIVARPLQMPCHFSRKRNGTISTNKGPWSFSWTVPYTRVQALYAAWGAADPAERPDMLLNRRGLQLISPPQWHQGLIFNASLQVVVPFDKRPPAPGDLTIIGNGCASALQATSSQRSADTRATDPQLPSSMEEDGAVDAAATAVAGSASEGEGEPSAGILAPGGVDTVPGADSVVGVPGAAPKLQCAVCVQVDPKLEGTYSVQGLMCHMAYSMKVTLTHTGGEKLYVQKVHNSALMPLDGHPLWKPLWRQTPACVFDPQNKEGGLEVAVQIIDVR